MKRIITKKNIPFWMAALMAMLVFISGESLSRADTTCLPLDDEPLEVKALGAPGLIMVAYDRSGSMNWSIMTDEEDGTSHVPYDSNGDGLITVLDTPREYEVLFDADSADASNASMILQNSATHKMQWETQWHGYNRIYYNPQVAYEPWPRWTTVRDTSNPRKLWMDTNATDNANLPNANPDTPRKHPKDAKRSSDFFDLDQVWAQVSLHPDEAESVIVDDRDPGSKFQKTASTGSWQLPNTAVGYNNRYSYLYGNGTATWKATLDPDASYSVFVKFVRYSNRTTLADYTVFNDGTDTTKQLNQRGNSTTASDWMPIAMNVKFSDTSGEAIVRLDNTDWNATTSMGSISADAVLFSTSPPVDIHMSHYFIHYDFGTIPVEGKENGTYLIDLDGTTETIKYYRVNDLNGDGTVDTVNTMTIEEAAAAGIVFGNYAKQRQNFANWFQFFRKRDFTGRNALAVLATNFTGVYMGVSTAPPSTDAPVRSLLVNGVSDQTDKLLSEIYSLARPSGDTPMEATVNKMGNYFRGLDTFSNSNDRAVMVDPGLASADSYPYYTEENGGSCQQAFLIVVTDGAYETNGPSNIGNTDGDDNTDFDGGKYADAYENTLADIAMYHYENDLRPALKDNGDANPKGLSNDVPINEYDDANHQHMVTFGLAYGTSGNFDPKNFPNCNKLGCTALACCPAWPEPVSGEPSTLDDLWHATVNGRGLFLNASNPQELLHALEAIKNNILERLGSSASVSTNSVQRQVGTLLYQGIYTTSVWKGDLRAFEIDVDTGAVAQRPKWIASESLDSRDPDARVVISSDGSAGIPFRYDSMNDEQKGTLLTSLQYAFGTAYSFGTEAYNFATITDTEVQELVPYLRGSGDFDRDQPGGIFRPRETMLGDIVHSEPYYHKGVVYVGANDGMFHAFDSENGYEYMAFVPNLLYDKLPFLSHTQYRHLYYINGSPYARTVTAADGNGQDLVVCTYAKGGKGLFVLDVTDVKAATEDGAADIVLWEYTATGDDDLGYTYPRAYIVRSASADHPWVVIFGNGYSSVNEKAVLYIIDAVNGPDEADGGMLLKIDTGVGGVGQCNGLSRTAIIDKDFDGKADYIYAGDLKGNLWKFDIRDSDEANWHVAFNDGTDPQPLFTARNADGIYQAITAEPDSMAVRYCQGGLRGSMVVFGTGKFLAEEDIADTTTQSMYGIYDWGVDWEYKENSLTADQDKYLGEFTAARELSNVANFDFAPAGMSLVQQTSFDSGKWRILADNEVRLHNIHYDFGTDMGWYYDFPDTKERLISDPLIRMQSVIYITNTPSLTPCSAGGTSFIYQVDACTGGSMGKPLFDVDGDGDIDEDDVVTVGDETFYPGGEEYDEMLYKPVEVGDETVYANDSDGIIHGITVTANPAGMSYWFTIGY